MLKFIDNFLNRITMYRLVLYYLIALILAAFIYGFIGILPIDPTALIFSTILIILICYLTNWIFARTFEAETNVESVYITALILALIISPVMASNYSGVGLLIFASVWAMASKYMFAIGKKHIFNPAAFAVALSAIAINQPATWWVAGNYALLPVVLIGGLLLVRKMRRFDLILSFALTTFITFIVTSHSPNYINPIVQTLIHSSLLFFAFAMLTEPLTTPPTSTLRISYGVLVGFLFAPNIHFGSLFMTPELALIIGNIFSYIVSPKGRYILTLKNIEKSASDVYDFIFSSDRKFNFSPGKYLEWTLGHSYPDNRGNRRYFTIASSPTENNLRFGIKFYKPSSSFKRALGAMKVGNKISASQLAGGFTLPKNTKKKLVFIAGGIGITPFRSMIQYLIDTKEARDIVIFYANRGISDIAYRDILDRAERELGINTIYALSEEENPAPNMIKGLISAKLIAKYVPDYVERTYYISGPHSMVETFKKTLSAMGVSRFKIKSDFFPGFA